MNIESSESKDICLHNVYAERDTISLKAIQDNGMIFHLNKPQ